MELLHRDYPGLVMSLELDRTGSVRAFTVEPMEWTDEVLSEAPAITTRLLRSLPLGQMHTLARTQLADFADASPPYDDDFAFVMRSWADLLRSTPRPGARGRPDLFYAELAADYCENLPSATPVKDLANAANYSESTIRNLLYEARRRGLLTQSPEGRAGGTLTDKAIRLLRDAEGERDGEH